jgi:hypothetical protein
MAATELFVRLEPVRAHRGVDCEILCGACNRVMALRQRYLVVMLAPPSHVDRLPATVECSFCHVPNVLEPVQLNVREEQ